MPLYEFECSDCGEAWETMALYEDRDNARQHEGCGGAAIRQFTVPKIGKPRHQMGAVITDHNEKTVGHVKGQFGTIARNKSKK